MLRFSEIIIYHPYNCNRFFLRSRADYFFAMVKFHLPIIRANTYPVDILRMVLKILRRENPLRPVLLAAVCHTESHPVFRRKPSGQCRQNYPQDCYAPEFQTGPYPVSSPNPLPPGTFSLINCLSHILFALFSNRFWEISRRTPLPPACRNT